MNHFTVSVFKSILRIVAAGFLINDDLQLAGLGFILAELAGILEEVV